MDRAQLGANTQLDVAQLNDQGATGRALLQGQAQLGVAGMNNQGAMARTQLSTDTQRDIAGQNNTLEQNRLNQQGTQFDQTLALDQQKAQEQAYQGRLGLARATVTRDAMNNPVTIQGLDFNTPPKVGVTGGFGLSAMSTDELGNALAQARRQQAMEGAANPQPPALGSPVGPSATPARTLVPGGDTTPPPAPASDPPARSLVPGGNAPFPSGGTSGWLPSVQPNGPGMTALRDIGSAVSNFKPSGDFGRGFRSLIGIGETGDQARARRAAAAAAGQ